MRDKFSYDTARPAPAAGSLLWRSQRMQYSISVENQPYPVLCTLSPDGCTAHVPDFPKIATQAATLEAALLEVKQQIQKALRQYKNPPIPTKQEQIVVPNNSVLVLVKAG